MPHSMSTRCNAILIAENTLQSSLLKESIEQRINIHVDLLPPSQLNSYAFNDTSVSLVMVDYPALSEALVSKYQQIKASHNGDVQEVLINAPSELPHTELLKWHNLIGIFYVSDNLETLVTGFNCILKGEMWMSRKLIFEYIRFYRDRQCPQTNPSYQKLTKREQQIIKLLGGGASNTEIADALFVSENTVKAHLHNTFKKINVKNRLQALIWIKNNIAASEFAQ